MSNQPKNKSCIYSITNTKNGKRYIGSTADLSKRRSDHFTRLNKGIHHSSHLQNAWNLYGSIYFVFDVVEYFNQERLVEREQYWIDYYKSNVDDYGYNIRKIADSNYGNKLSEATREKMRMAHKGKSPSPHTLLAATLAKLGKPRSQETRNKIKESLRIKRDAGWKHPFVPINPPRPREVVIKIREMSMGGMTQRQIEKDTGVSHSVVCHMVNKIKPYEYD